MKMKHIFCLLAGFLSILPVAAVYSVADGTDGDLPLIFSQSSGTTGTNSKYILEPSVWGDKAIPHDDADYVVMSNHTQVK